MTAADVFTQASASWDWRLQLLDEEPIIVRLAGGVGAVPILEHRTPESLRHERVVPRPQRARHERRQADVLARRQDSLEVAFALEERDLKEPLSVDLEKVERREDLTAAE